MGGGGVTEFSLASASSLLPPLQEIKEIASADCVCAPHCWCFLFVSCSEHVNEVRRMLGTGNLASGRTSERELTGRAIKAQGLYSKAQHVNVDSFPPFTFNYSDRLLRKRVGKRCVKFLQYWRILFGSLYVSFTQNQDIVFWVTGWCGHNMAPQMAQHRYTCLALCVNSSILARDCRAIDV